jgi:hypothetical protein
MTSSRPWEVAIFERRAVAWLGWLLRRMLSNMNSPPSVMFHVAMIEAIAAALSG